MLRNLFGLVLATHILGPVWTLIASLMLLAGFAGLAHMVWYALTGSA